MHNAQCTIWAAPLLMHNAQFSMHNNENETSIFHSDNYNDLIEL